MRIDLGGSDIFVSQENPHLVRSHVLGMPPLACLLLAKKQKPAHPVPIRFFRAPRQLPIPCHLMELIAQTRLGIGQQPGRLPWFGSRTGPRPGSLIRRVAHKISELTCLEPKQVATVLLSEASENFMEQNGLGASHRSHVRNLSLVSFHPDRLRKPGDRLRNSSFSQLT